MPSAYLCSPFLSPLPYVCLTAGNIQGTPVTPPISLDCKSFIGQRSLSNPLLLFPLYVQALSNMVCLMCWKFHLTLLLPLLSLSLHLSSLRSVIAWSLPTFSTSYPTPLFTISLGLTAFLQVVKQKLRG